MKLFENINYVFVAALLKGRAAGQRIQNVRLLMCLFFAGFILLQSPLVNGIALAAGTSSFDPRVVLDGLISTCGLVILVAGGVLGVRMFFNGQMVQAVVAVIIAAFVFTLLNTAALKELGMGLKSFIWAGDQGSSAISKP